jgi:hypothetical protein
VFLRRKKKSLIDAQQYARQQLGSFNQTALSTVYLLIADKGYISFEDIVALTGYESTVVLHCCLLLIQKLLIAVDEKRPLTEVYLYDIEYITKIYSMTWEFSK